MAMLFKSPLSVTCGNTEGSSQKREREREVKMVSGFMGIIFSEDHNWENDMVHLFKMCREGTERTSSFAKSPQSPLCRACRTCRTQVFLEILQQTTGR